MPRQQAQIKQLSFPRQLHRDAGQHTRRPIPAVVEHGAAAHGHGREPGQPIAQPREGAVRIRELAAIEKALVAVLEAQRQPPGAPVPRLDGRRVHVPRLAAGLIHTGALEGVPSAQVQARCDAPRGGHLRLPIQDGRPRAGHSLTWQGGGVRHTEEPAAELQAHPPCQRLAQIHPRPMIQRGVPRAVPHQHVRCIEGLARGQGILHLQPQARGQLAHELAARSRSRSRISSTEVIVIAALGRQPQRGVEDPRRERRGPSEQHARHQELSHRTHALHPPRPSPSPTALCSSPTGSRNNDGVPRTQEEFLGVLRRDQIAVTHGDLPLWAIVADDDDAVRVGEVREATRQRDRLNERHAPPERISAGVSHLTGDEHAAAVHLPEDDRHARLLNVGLETFLDLLAQFGRRLARGQDIPRHGHGDVAIWTNRQGARKVSIPPHGDVQHVLAPDAVRLIRVIYLQCGLVGASRQEQTAHHRPEPHPSLAHRSLLLSDDVFPSHLSPPYGSKRHMASARMPKHPLCQASG
ncbi:hypothetical protein STIAU_5061 [Stigmatella aurantiaca DW4/3-1]|uniref:Uncharacterized protein n=1 Tax=Stigmatella aurantiaca (strain DW4/3-1) TaxID=378806 RepID=Q098E1_STIAD|nr:hypothetical protein STIAU_5061 [Stigmatella aurantiaca DW4/3-1]